MSEKELLPDAVSGSEEREEINHSIDIFSEWMGKRMHCKFSKGFTGWQTPQNFNVKERLLMKAAKIAAKEEVDDKDLVDLANFAMMLFMERWKKTFPFNPRNHEMNLQQKVNLAMKHTNKACIGEPCDLDAPCKRHSITIGVVQRLARRIGL